jgi:cytoskeleton protein RodZ
MSGIGSKLREERVRRGLGIDEVEAGTRIRAKYLLALEDDQFELLPGDAYVRAFLRDYAEELGLDAQQLVDELNAVTAPPQEVVLAPPRTAERLWSPWDDRRRLAGMAIAAAVALVVAGVAVLALLGAFGGGSGAAGPSTGRPPSSSSPPPSTPSTQTPPPVHRTRPVAALALAASGPCWLEVRAGSATGRLIYLGTLEAGQTRHFATGPLWVRVGAPWELSMRVHGHPMPLPISAAGSMLVTASGATPA